MTNIFHVSLKAFTNDSCQTNTKRRSALKLQTRTFRRQTFDHSVFFKQQPLSIRALLGLSLYTPDVFNDNTKRAAARGINLSPTSGDGKECPEFSIHP